MKLWMSGEVEADVGEALRHARAAVQAAVNDRLADTDYGGGVTEWTFITMISSGRIAPDQPEIKRYHRRDGSLEFRLRVNHTAFRAASSVGREQLLFEALRRSLDVIPALRVANFDVARLRSDVDAVGRERGWLVAETRSLQDPDRVT